MSSLRYELNEVAKLYNRNDIFSRDERLKLKELMKKNSNIRKHKFSKFTRLQLVCLSYCMINDLNIFSYLNPSHDLKQLTEITKGLKDNLDV